MDMVARMLEVTGEKKAARRDRREVGHLAEDIACAKTLRSEGM